MKIWGAVLYALGVGLFSASLGLAQSNAGARFRMVATEDEGCGERAGLLEEECQMDVRGIGGAREVPEEGWSPWG